MKVRGGRGKEVTEGSATAVIEDSYLSINKR